MEPVDILKAARELIELPAGWSQGAYARDWTGRAVGLLQPQACQFCSVGAVARIAGSDRTFSLSTTGAMSALMDAMSGDIPRFNDSHTHEEVLAAFDKAIDALSHASD